jgi:hypothetical protein
VSLRRKRRRRPIGGIVAIGVLLAALAVCLVTSRGWRAETATVRRAPSNAGLPVRPASMREPARVVYPYSVLSGGVWSRAELARRLAGDAVAAAHYRGFRTAAARVERLSSARRAYVSYRIDNAVYWTRAPVVIPAGEAVITDGENVARARCGNRLSSQRMLPLGRDVDLDTPEIPPPAGGNSAAALPEFFDRPLLVHDLFPPAGVEGSESTAARDMLPADGWPSGPPGGDGLGGGLAGGLATLVTPDGKSDLVAAPPATVDPGLGALGMLFPSPPPVPVWGVMLPGLPPITNISSGLPPPGPPSFLPPGNTPPLTVGTPGGPHGPGRPGTGPVPDPPGLPPTGLPPPNSKRPPPEPPSVPRPVPPPVGPPPSEVPEPATMVLVLGAGALGLAIRRNMR